MLQATQQRQNCETRREGEPGARGAGYAGDGRITVELKEQKIQTKIYELKSELK